MNAKTLTLRAALPRDIPDLARIANAAFGGFGQVMYEEAVPGRSALDLLEHRFSRAHTSGSLTNSHIAEMEKRVVGGLHAFPADWEAQDPPDLLIPAEREPYFAPFVGLEASSSYYINAVTVFEPFQGRGIARQLMDFAEDLARGKGFNQTSLHVFAENGPAIRLYERRGYREAGRNPLVPHPALQFRGDLLLLVKDL